MRTVDYILIIKDGRRFTVLLHYEDGVPYRGGDVWHIRDRFDDAVRIGRNMAHSRNVPLVINETRDDA